MEYILLLSLYRGLLRSVLERRELYAAVAYYRVMSQRCGAIHNARGASFYREQAELYTRRIARGRRPAEERRVHYPGIREEIRSWVRLSESAGGGGVAAPDYAGADSLGTAAVAAFRGTGEGGRLRDEVSV